MGNKIVETISAETKAQADSIEFEIESDESNAGWYVQLRSKAIACESEQEAFNLWRELRERYHVKS